MKYEVDLSNGSRRNKYGYIIAVDEQFHASGLVSAVR